MMDCHEFRDIVDSYLSNELLVETNHEVISHLRQCVKCRRELAARRELRGKLRDAFIDSPENQMRPEFEKELSSRLRAYALEQRTQAKIARASLLRQRVAWFTLAASLLLVFVIGVVLLRQPREEVAAGKKQNPSGLSSQIPGSVQTELVKSAVGDHRDCAVKFRLLEKPIDLEIAGHKYDPVYLNLRQALFSQQAQIASDLQFLEAHSCVFEGRRFAHLVLKYRGSLVSFLVTDIVAEGERVSTATASNTQPQVISCAQMDGYQVSCFRTAHHAIFLVSDLSEGENLALMRTLAPSAYSHITNTESAG